MSSSTSSPPRPEETKEQLLERLADFSFRHHQDKIRTQMLEQTIVKQQYRIDVLESSVQGMAKKEQGAFRNINVFGHLVQDNILPVTSSSPDNSNNSALVAASITSANNSENNNNNNNQLVTVPGQQQQGGSEQPLPPPRRNASNNPRHRSLSVVTTEADKTQIDQAVLVRRNESLQEDMHKQFMKHSHSEHSHRSREKELELEIDSLKDRLKQIEGERHSLSGRVADMILTQRAATNLQNLLSKVQSQRATRNSCLLRLEAAERERMESHDDLSYTYRHDPSVVNAPRGTVVVVFTDIFNFSSITSESSQHRDFAKFVTKQYLETIRECANLTKGYNVTTSAGYETHRLANNSEIIMHCFSNAVDAILFASEVQLRMVKQAWPETMLNDPRFEVVRTQAGGNGALLFNGPRVRSGLHITELSTEFDEGSCSMKYRGEGLSVAAMAAARARPGEIIITSDFWKRLKEEMGPAPADDDAKKQIIQNAAAGLSMSTSQQQQRLASTNAAFARSAILEDFFALWCDEPTSGAQFLQQSNQQLISVVPPPLHEGRRSWWKNGPDAQYCSSLEELCKFSPEFTAKLKDPLLWTKGLGIAAASTSRLVVCGSKTQKSHVTLLEKKKLRKNWTPIEEADFEIHNLRSELQKQFFLSTMARRSLEGYERSQMWEHDFYERAAEKPPEGTIGLAFVRIHQQDKITNEINADVMTEAVRNFHNQIRQGCRRNRGYLVKRDGELMMIAFPSLVFMLEFASQVHLNMLTQVDWNAEFDQHQATSSEFPDDDTTKKPILRGLRCSIAMNLVQPVCERDPVTLKMEYLGPSVQILAQVILHARGGESLIGEDGFQAARKAGLLGEKSQFVVVPRGLKSIPGVRRPEMTYAMLPRQLNARFTFWIRADQDEAAGIPWKPRDLTVSTFPLTRGSKSSATNNKNQQNAANDRNAGNNRPGTRGTSSGGRAGSARNTVAHPPSSSRRGGSSPERARTAAGGTNPRFRRDGRRDASGKDKDEKTNELARDLTGDMHVVASVPNDTSHLVSRVGKLLTHYNDAGVVNVSAEQAGTLRAVRRLRHEKQRLEKAYAAAETNMMMLHDESGLVADVPYLGRAAVVLLDAPGLEKLSISVGDAIKQKAFLMYRQVINDKCDLYDGYRVKHNGEDGFMIVFRNVAVALQFSAEVQTGLLHCAWPSDLSKLDPTLRVRETKQREGKSSSSQQQKQQQDGSNNTNNDENNNNNNTNSNYQQDDNNNNKNKSSTNSNTNNNNKPKRDPGPLATPATQQQLLFHGIRCRAGIALGDVHTQFDPFTRRTDYSSGPVAFMAYRTCQAAFPGEVCLSADAMKELYKLDLHAGGSLLHSVKIGPKVNLHTNVDDGIPTVSGEAARLFSVLPNHLAGRSSKFPQSNSQMKRIGSRKNKTNNNNNDTNNTESAKPERDMTYRRRLTIDEVLALTRELWWRQVNHLTTPIVIQRLRRYRHAVPSIIVSELGASNNYQMLMNSPASPFLISSGGYGSPSNSTNALMMSPNSGGKDGGEGMTNNNTNNNSAGVASLLSNNNTINNKDHQFSIGSPYNHSASLQPLPTAGASGAGTKHNTGSKLQAFNHNVAAASKQPFSNPSISPNSPGKDHISISTSNQDASIHSLSLQPPSSQQQQQQVAPGSSPNQQGLLTDTFTGAEYQQLLLTQQNTTTSTTTLTKKQQQQASSSNNHNSSNNININMMNNTGGGALSSGTFNNTTKDSNNNSTFNTNRDASGTFNSTTNNNTNSLLSQQIADSGSGNYQQQQYIQQPPVAVAADYEAHVVSIEDMCRHAANRVEKLVEILHSNSNPLDGTLSPIKLALEMEHVLLFAKTLFSTFMRSGVLKSRNIVSTVAALSVPVEKSYIQLVREPLSFVEQPFRKMILDAQQKRSGINCVNCGLSLTDYRFCPKTGAAHDRTTRFFGYKKKDPMVPTPNEVRRLIDDFAAVDDDFDGRITLPQLQTMLAWNGEYIDDVTFSAITSSAPEAKAGVATADDLLTVRPVDLLRALHPSLREPELVAIIDEATAGTPSDRSDDDEDEDMLIDSEDDEDDSKGNTPASRVLGASVSDPLQRKSTDVPMSRIGGGGGERDPNNQTTNTIPDAGASTVRGSRAHTPISTIAAGSEYNHLEDDDEDEDRHEDGNENNNTNTNTNRSGDQVATRRQSQSGDLPSSENGEQPARSGNALMNMFEATLRGLDGSADTNQNNNTVNTNPSEDDLPTPSDTGNDNNDNNNNYRQENNTNEENQTTRARQENNRNNAENTPASSSTNHDQQQRHHQQEENPVSVITLTPPTEQNFATAVDGDPVLETNNLFAMARQQQPNANNNTGITPAGGSSNRNQTSSSRVARERSNSTNNNGVEPDHSGLTSPPELTLTTR